MSKVLFVGDVHLSPRTPSSRKDDYSETILNKVKSLLPISKQNDVSHIIFLGDLFNTKHMTLPYFIKCFQVFKELKDAGISLHLIIGNHDIYYNSDSTMQDSPIQLLLDADLFNNTSFTIDDVYIQLVNYTTITQDLPKAPTDKYSILVGHYFFNIGFGDTEHTISKEQAEDLKYNSYMLGHDHTPYDPIILSNYSVYRPGSLSRGTSVSCQINRDEINVILFDTITKQYTNIPLTHIISSRDVFKESNLIAKVSMSDIDESLQELLQSLDFDNSSDIAETLNQIPMSNEIKNIVYQYLNDEGVYLGGDN